MLRNRGALVILLVATTSFSFGLGLAHADSRANWCDDACDSACSGRGGCDVAMASGCTCDIVCNDGHDTFAYCTF